MRVWKYAFLLDEATPQEEGGLKKPKILQSILMKESVSQSVQL